MADTITQQIILKERPAGVPEPEHFALQEAAVRTPEDGEIVCRNLFLSLDPYMRGQIAGRHISGPVNEGDVLRGETISEVIESRHPDYAAGDRILIQGGWQTISTLAPEGARRVDPRIDPPSLALGILGMPGLTAYAGLKYLGEPKEGDVLVVSAASGAVGSMVGQYGKALGCRVIGIAGSDDKCAWLTDVAGFDATINYKTESVADGIDRLCPDGVDIYFDNVGGETLDAVIWRLALGGRVILCGLISQMNQDDRPSGPNPASIIKARATVRGLVVYDFWDKFGEMLDTFTPMVADGRIRYLEDVSEGVEAAPEAFSRLMRGANFGKTIIKLS